MAFRDEPFHIDGDLAYVLCQQYNEIATIVDGDLETIDEEYVLKTLQEKFDMDTVATLVQDDFGRGALMGMIAFIRDQEALTELEEA